MRQWVLSLVLLGAVQSSHATDMSIGVQLGGVLDFTDRASAEHTQFGFGPALALTYRLRFSEYARARFGVQSHLATGSDRVSWEVEVDGEPVRLHDDEHFAMVVGLGVTAGFDVMVPKDMVVTPYFGGDVGVSWFGTYHSLGGNTQVLLDPGQNELDNPNNVDPYTSQFAWVTEFHVGLEKGFGDRVLVHLETGYQMAFLDAQPLKKASEGYDAQREAYGWNALRLGLGVGFLF